MLDRVGRVLHQYTTELLLSPRPDPSTQVVEVDSGGVPWPVWVAIGAAVVGAGVTIGFLAQPNRPDQGDDPNTPLIKVPR